MKLNKKEINKKALKVINKMGWHIENIEELEKNLDVEILHGTNFNLIVKIDNGVIKSITKEELKVEKVFDYEHMEVENVEDQEYCSEVKAIGESILDTIDFEDDSIGYIGDIVYDYIKNMDDLVYEVVRYVKKRLKVENG